MSRPVGLSAPSGPDRPRGWVVLALGTVIAIVGVGHTPQGELPGQSPELNSVLAIKEALADAGVQALLEVFPAEIRDVEEM